MLVGGSAPASYSSRRYLSTPSRARCGHFTSDQPHSHSRVNKAPARSVMLHTNSLVARASSVRNEKLESLALPRSLPNCNKPHIRFHRFPTARKLTPKISGDYCPLFCMEFNYCAYTKLKLYPITLITSAQIDGICYHVYSLWPCTRVCKHQQLQVLCASASAYTYSL